ncbi:MAG: hypothetical protein FWE32_06965 [Oscillospiraceae bacterium]|nr:hypothetical protein [Oscillospiraceae bacterium]
MNDLNALYKNVITFIVKLRENTFDDTLYTEIFAQFETLVFQWKTHDHIPKLAFISCVYLIDALAGGSRFWPDDIRIKAEDALIAIQEQIAGLELDIPDLEI